MSTSTTEAIDIPVAHRMRFNGNTSEYFRIWIVNLFLTVVTLGLYSPWAKVRTQRYFLGNTELDSARFEYTGDPVKILMGRLLIASVFGVYFLITNVFPLAGIVGALGLLAFSPWAIVNSLAFRLRNTVYRGIRFGFERDYQDAYVTYICWMILVPAVTLGLGYPRAITEWYRFLARNARFGSASMTAQLSARPIYAMLFKALGGIVGAVLLVGGTYWLAAENIGSLLIGMDSSVKQVLILVAVYVLILSIYAAVGITLSLVAIETKKLFWNTSQLGTVKFKSTVSPLWVVWIGFSNGVAIAASLGLLYPWARVRKYEYMLEHMKVIEPAGEISRFTQSPDAAINALGEATADIFEIGVEL